MEAGSSLQEWVYCKWMWPLLPWYSIMRKALIDTEPSSWASQPLQLTIGAKSLIWQCSSAVEYILRLTEPWVQSPIQKRNATSNLCSLWITQAHIACDSVRSGLRQCCLHSLGTHSFQENTDFYSGLGCRSSLTAVLQVSPSVFLLSTVCLWCLRDFDCVYEINCWVQGTKTKRAGKGLQRLEWRVFT